jgi:ABC-type uncharacterized transport system substrate-binding protein
MRRRDFIFLVSSNAVPWPFAASAQQRDGKLRHLGFLTAVSGPVFSGNYAEFVHGMRELGYEEHKDFVTELRTAEGNYERFPDLARELVEQKVDILLTGVAAAIRHLQQATATIPIVMVYSTDPVKNGFVASLAHPGGNITGLAGSSDDTAPKQLELLATFVPRGSRIAVLGNPASPNYTGVLKGAQASAEKAGLSVLPTEARSPEEIANAFATLDKEGAQGAIVAGDAIQLSPTNVQVYFCDPHSPWQRGSNENTNGLLRQYFPRGTDLSRFSQDYLNRIARRLNQRPRKTLGFETPADRLQAVLH